MSQQTPAEVPTFADSQAEQNQVPSVEAPVALPENAPEAVKDLGDVAVGPQTVEAPQAPVPGPEVQDPQGPASLPPAA